MENPYKPYIIKKARTKWFWLRILFFCFFVGIFLVVAVVKIFNLPIFNFLFNKSERNEINMYCVCLNTENMESSSADIAKTYRARGGAGVVLNREGRDFVILSCYKNQSDAKTVVENLSGTEPNLSVIEIKILEPSLKNLEDDDCEQFKTIFNFLKEIIFSLDEIVLNLSQNKLSDVNANLQLNNMLLKTKFYEQKLLEKEKLEKTSYVLSNVENVLNYVCGETALTENYLSYQAEIRRALVRIVLVVYENFGA